MSRTAALLRATDRGLGTQTRAWWRHLDVKPLVVLNPADAGLGFPSHRDEWYPVDAPTVTMDAGQLVEESTVRDWLEDVDVVATAESWYDDRILGWAREQGVRSVNQMNAEMHRAHRTRGIAHPDEYAPPTSWLIDRFPRGTRVLPVPVDLELFAAAQQANEIPHKGPLRVLHVIGHRAAGDRHGTDAFLAALPLLREEVHVRITSVGDEQIEVPPLPVNVTYTIVGHVPDARDLYALQDVLVLPRRYGGLSLPTIEAMASGLAVMMTDTEPQRKAWPIVPIPCRKGEPHLGPGGHVPTVDAEPADIAAKIDNLARSRDFLEHAKDAALSWAEFNSWEKLGHLYAERFGCAVR